MEKYRKTDPVPAKFTQTQNKDLKKQVFFYPT